MYLSIVSMLFHRQHTSIDTVQISMYLLHVFFAQKSLHRNLASSLKEEVPLTPSLNRKILATKAAANLEDSHLRVVASHMTHDVKMAARCYHIPRNAETEMDAYQLLNTLVRKVFLLNTRHKYY